MVHLLRHTKPYIEPNICYGQSDIPLPRDFKTVYLPKVINEIKNLQISTIYTSPLIRCKTLAEEVANYLNIDSIYEDQRLMEMNFGEWELKSWDTIYSSNLGNEWFADFLNIRCPNGESFNDLINRAIDFNNQIDNKKNILIVTHAGFIRAFAVINNLITKNKAFSLAVKYGELFDKNSEARSPN